MADHFIFDFDSTLTQVEALDILAEITTSNPKEREKLVAQIKEITDLGVDGSISFTQSLESRLKLIKANKSDLDRLVDHLKGKISKSISDNKEFFVTNKGKIKVISCGFKEFIDPIVEEYDIESNDVYANTFTFDEEGFITGFDSSNVLSHHNGKIECLKSLNLDGKVYVIGDGYSDYVMREAGIADKFSFR